MATGRIRSLLLGLWGSLALGTASAQTSDTGALVDKVASGVVTIEYRVPRAFDTYGPATGLSATGFVVDADKIKAKGVDRIICTSVNDTFVMDAWGKAHNAEDIVMLADGMGDFAKALGLTQDRTANQMGIRSQRYAMIVDDGVVKLLNIDEKGLESTSSEAILAAL